MAYFGSCFTCGRGEQTTEMCSYCRADYPDIWAARQGLVAGPQITTDEQARMDRAIDIVLQDAFFGPQGPQGLSNSTGY